MAETGNAVKVPEVLRNHPSWRKRWHVVTTGRHAGVVAHDASGWPISIDINVGLPGLAEEMAHALCGMLNGADPQGEQS